MALPTPADMTNQWSSSGPIQTPPTSGYITAGWSPAQVPPAQIFNWLDNRQDLNLNAAMQCGILPWVSTFTYPQYGLILGVDGNIYQSLQNANTNNNPATPSPTWWAKLSLSNLQYSGTTSGTNTYTLTNPNIASYYPGLIVSASIGTTNTGPSTLNINGLGAIAINTSAGYLISAGDLVAQGQSAYQFLYTGAAFSLINPSDNDAAGIISSNYSASGYIRMRSGLTFQWFEASIGTGPTTVSFPFTFSSAAFNVVISDSGATAGSFGAANLTPSNFTAYGSNAGLVGRIIAIGV